MDVFGILSFIGGLAMFLFGMNVLSSGLEKVSGSRLQQTLGQMTSSKIKGVGLGMTVTAVIQSSSATTVMLVGFVNAGIMSLYQATNVIMGANIGTTVTGWITGLTGLDAEGFLLQFLKPANFSPLIALAGAILLMFGKGKKKDLGSIFLGFAVLMFGMTQMSDAMKPLSENETFRSLLLAFNNPLLGLIVGAFFTAVIQSSSASIGILQAVAATNGLTYNMAIPIIMGQNIGTCVTALLSCIGASKNAKRTAMVHLYFNLIGSALFIGAYYAIKGIAPSLFPFADDVLTTFGIAVIHTVFNLLTTLVMLPMSRQLCRLAQWTIPEKKGETERVTRLDERFLATPSVAVQQCKAVIREMSGIAEESLTMALSLLEQYDPKSEEKLRKKEDLLDRFEDELGTYLVQLSGRELTEEESREVSKILHAIGDYERIGDHALNILYAAKEVFEKQIAFSGQAQNEIRVLAGAVGEIMQMTRKACDMEDLLLATRVEPLEQVIDDLKAEIKHRHIDRLQEGRCTIELGFVLNELLTNFERISDHCSNLAACMIQLHQHSLETHQYLNLLKYSGQEEFTENYREFHDRFPLPPSKEV